MIVIKVGGGTTLDIDAIVADIVTLRRQAPNCCSSTEALRRPMRSPRRLGTSAVRHQRERTSVGAPIAGRSRSSKWSTAGS